MDKIILTILLLVMTVQSHPTLTYSKVDCCFRAKQHTQQAKSFLLYAKEGCAFIPDLDEREELLTFINAGITSLAAGAAGADKKTCFFAAFFVIVTASVCKIIEQYGDIQKNFYMAEYHFQMADFYNKLSLHADAKIKNTDKGTFFVFDAIDDLTGAIIASRCLEDDPEREFITEELEKLRARILIAFKNTGKIPYSVYEDTIGFYENMEEMLAEFPNSGWKAILGTHMYAAVENIACALNEFEGYKCNPSDDIYEFDEYNPTEDFYDMCSTLKELDESSKLYNFINQTRNDLLLIESK